MANYICAPVKDLTGAVFGRLTVLSYAGGSAWKCLCSCGAEVIVKTYPLKKGLTRSCGCIRREVAAKKATKHNGVHDPLYPVLNAMHQRCENAKDKSYKWYGALGVTVCDEWALTNFQAFRDWAISSGYQPGLTIDRKDPTGNYTPENCRWITIQEQQRNRRNSKKERTTKCSTEKNVGF